MHILFRHYMKYKSEKRAPPLYVSRSRREGRLEILFPPARILFSASRLLCLPKLSTLRPQRAGERERDGGRQRAIERENLPAQSIYEAPRCGAPRRIAICIFRRRLYARAHPRRQRGPLFARGTFHPRPVYRLILLFHSSKFKHFTPARLRFVPPSSSARGGAEPR